MTHRHDRGRKGIREALARVRPRERRGDRLVRLEDALAALGHAGEIGRRCDEVPVEQIVGSAERPGDFDADFRLINPALAQRWDAVARLVRSGQAPPVQLVQLGDLYFVVDGHHRVSVARHDGHAVVSAQVRRISTVAYAMACLRAEHLASKNAERSFLQRVPLPDRVRRQLWLDRPADWLRLADAAEAWALRCMQRPDIDGLDRHGLADAWWRQEVEPMLERLRAAGIGLELRDVQLYVAALAVRDGLGVSSWPDDLAEHMRTAH